ncbi:selenocysteine insertion sequence-binding protein 2-like [Conger conger]|uniref:selenocysteine insertion sequence-binding protein 2-like n=1 Tax=Conger conger TaxID=82655 RepID=UPI002A5996AF|nr:selenocysteine insertion sequence-binding protein 2-like [Conger conger]
MNHHARTQNTESRSSRKPVTTRLQEADGKGQPVLHSPELPATSWASVASLLPVKTIRALNSRTTSQEDQPQLALEQVSEKKRKKKKKSKKSNDDGQVENCDTPTTDQRPPQFQDEGEFPELALASVSGRSNTTGPFSSSSLAKQQNEKFEKNGGKKSKVPVQLDLGSMLAVLEGKQQSSKSKHDTKPIVLSVGGALPVFHKDPSAQKHLPRHVSHNPLDSTSPLVKKGKQREVPKAKKPTPLKKIILKEREERKQNRLLEEQGFVPQTEESGLSSNPNEDLQGTTVSEEDPLGLTRADSQMLDFPNPKLYEDDEPEQEIAEESTHLEACLPSHPKIHSRKFRDYCSQMLSKDVDECVTILLKELVRFQDRLYQKDPMKARMKRRLVMGLREVLKHLKLRKIKCVIISPNCERVQSKGGLDEALHTIIDTCQEQCVPFVFALSRKALGRCVNKAVPVSLVGIFNYDGAQDHYHNMIELSSQARKAYEVMIANLENSAEEEKKIPVDEHSLDTTVSPLENEEPEYIKIWKKMLDMDCPECRWMKRREVVE